MAFVINAENMPLIHKKQTATERQQEDNLFYVALTRGQTTLALISDEPTKISWLPQKYLKKEEEQMTIESNQPNQPFSPEPSEVWEDLTYSEIPEEDLFALIAKIEVLPRSQKRTIIRELIDRLGRESIVSLLD